MLRAGKIRALFVAMVFTFGMFCASLCSTLCAEGVCPYELQQSASNHLPASHSSSSHKRAPGDSDCALHPHPDYSAVKAGSHFQVGLTGAGRLTAHVLLVNAPRLTSFDQAVSSLSGLAPPPNLRSLLQQQTFILRIWFSAPIVLDTGLRPGVTRASFNNKNARASSPWPAISRAQIHRSPDNVSSTDRCKTEPGRRAARRHGFWNSRRTNSARGTNHAQR